MNIEVKHGEDKYRIETKKPLKKEEMAQGFLVAICEVAEKIKFNTTLLENLGIKKVVNTDYDGEGGQLILYG